MSEKDKAVHSGGERPSITIWLIRYSETIYCLIQIRTKVPTTGIRVRRVKLSFGIYNEILKSRRKKIYDHPNILGRLVFILNPSDRTPGLAVNRTLNSHYDCDEWHTAGARALRE